MDPHLIGLFTFAALAMAFVSWNASNDTRAYKMPDLEIEDLENRIFEYLDTRLLTSSDEYQPMFTGNSGTQIAAALQRQTRDFVSEALVHVALNNLVRRGVLLRRVASGRLHHTIAYEIDYSNPSPRPKRALLGPVACPIQV